MPRNREISVTEVSKYDQFVDMQEAWNAILLKRSQSSIFLKHEWFDAAWQWCKQSSALRILRCFRGSDLVAIAPLSSTKLKGQFVSYTRLSVIHVPDSQQCDIVVSDEDSALAVASIIEYLSSRTDWDTAIFPKLQLDSCMATYAADASAKAHLKFVMTDADENPEVDLTNNWQSYYSSRSRRLKKSNNNCRNKIYADGNTVKLHWSAESVSEQPTTEYLLSSLKHVSSVSWKKHTGLSLDNIGPGAFIDRLSEHSIRNKWLSIWALEINNKIVATEYQLIHEGVVVALRADHDPSFASLSPGSYLNWRILETLFGSENTLYRMGPGNNPYKLRWADKLTTLKELRLYNTTPRGWYLWFIEARMRPLLRQIINTLSQVRVHLLALRHKGPNSG